MPRRAKTTISSAGKTTWWRRKLSRMTLLTRLRTTASFTCFLAIAIPNRGCVRWFSANNTVKFSSMLLRALEKTCLNSAALNSRRLRSNFSWLTKTRQADRRFRPLARRAFNIFLPLRVFIRARKPWLRFRFILLGWNVLFMTVSV